MMSRSLLLMYVTTSLLAIGAIPTMRQSPASRPATQPGSGLDDEVFEAVFRYQFEHNLSMKQQKAAVYYLSVQQEKPAADDPDDTFMKRFAGHKPPVRTVSQRYEPGADAGVIFRIDSIRWIDGKAEVHGGYYEGLSDSAGSVYTVEKVHGKWKVTAEKLEWIS